MEGIEAKEKVEEGGMQMPFIQRFDAHSAFSVQERMGMKGVEECWKS